MLINSDGDTFTGNAFVSKKTLINTSKILDFSIFFFEHLFHVSSNLHKWLNVVNKWIKIHRWRNFLFLIISVTDFSKGCSEDFTVIINGTSYVTFGFKLVSSTSLGKNFACQGLYLFSTSKFSFCSYCTFSFLASKVMLDMKVQQWLNHPHRVSFYY